MAVFEVGFISVKLVRLTFHIEKIVNTLTLSTKTELHSYIVANDMHLHFISKQLFLFFDTSIYF